MSIRKRLILIFSLIFLIGFLTTTTIYNSVFIDNLKNVEKFFINREFTSLSNFLENYLGYINSTAENEAYWDDLYSFVINPNKEFIKSNFDPENKTLKNIGIDFFLIIAGDHKISLFRCILEQKLCNNVKNEMLKIIKEKNQEINGFLKTKNCVYLISARYIPPTNENKDPAGFLVLGKKLDENFITGLLKNSYIKIQNGIPAIPESPVFRLKKGRYEASVYPGINDENLYYTFYAEDINRKKISLFEGSIHRIIWLNAKQAITMFQIFLILLFVGLFAATLISIENFVSRPLNVLIGKIRKITTEKDFDIKVKDSYGSKEIDLLSQEIQNMVNRIKDLFEELSEKNQIFKIIAENTPIGIYIFSDKFEYVNKAFEKLTGYQKEEIEGKPISIFMAELDENTKKKIYEAVKRRLKGEQFRNEFQAEIRTKDGTKKTFLVIANTIFLSGKPYGLGIALDITDMKRLEKKLIQLIEKDALTGLLSRYAFSREIKQFIQLFTREKRRFFLLFFDLNRFKNINDTYGHHVGDQVLKVIADRLTNTLRKTDIIGRLGGDEFGILITTYSKFEDITKILEKITAEIEKTVNIEDFSFNLTTSIGIAIFPDDGTDPETLLKRADIAMYKAKDNSKESGRSEAVFFSEDLENKIKEKIDIERELKKALKENPEEFYLEYQPIINLENLKIEKVESLIRWNSSKFGKTSPEKFIKIAEETGIIKEITDLVIEKSLSQLKDWRDKGISIKMSINVSPTEFKDRDFVSRVVNKIPSDMRSFFSVEITENVLLEDVNLSIEKLRKLRSYGIDILLDDFGTGYSSLTYLKKFPLTMLKIDRDFIKDLPEDKDDQGIVTTIIKLAQILNLSSIAEGIETEAQFLFLRNAKCRYGQGYLFSKPLPADSVEKIIRDGYLHSVKLS